MTVPVVTMDEVREVCDATDALLAGLRALKSRGVANPGSPAMSEWATFKKPAELRVTWEQAFLCNEVAAEHLDALVYTIKAERFIAVPFSCLRVELEAAATSLWLLEKDIGAALRAQRGFAVRYQALRQQRAFAESAKTKVWTIPTTTPLDWGATIKKIDERIADLENDAASLGFTPVVDKHGKRISLGVTWPGSTELVKQVFGIDAELHYRIASAVVHSSPSQLLGLTFGEVSDPKPGEAGVIKSVPAIALSAICTAGIECFARSAWANAIYLSTDKPEILALFESAYDRFNLKDERRFWR